MTGRALVSNRKLTTRQLAVAQALLAQPSFISAQDLHAQMRSDGGAIGLATVYRAVASMAEHGDVDVLRGDDGETRYRLCGNTGHHHHLVCRSCGRTEEVQGEGVEVWARTEASRFGFSNVTHTVELSGTCRECNSG